MRFGCWPTSAEFYGITACCTSSLALLYCGFTIKPHMTRVRYSLVPFKGTGRVLMDAGAGAGAGVVSDFGTRGCIPCQGWCSGKFRDEAGGVIKCGALGFREILIDRLRYISNSCTEDLPYLDSFPSRLHLGLRVMQNGCHTRVSCFFHLPNKQTLSQMAKKTVSLSSNICIYLKLIGPGHQENFEVYKQYKPAMSVNKDKCL
jgi:hypothetical protein